VPAVRKLGAGKKVETQAASSKQLTPKQLTPKQLTPKQQAADAQAGAPERCLLPSPPCFFLFYL